MIKNLTSLPPNLQRNGMSAGITFVVIGSSVVSFIYKVKLVMLRNKKNIKNHETLAFSMAMDLPYYF